MTKWVMGKEWTLAENDAQGEWTLPNGWVWVTIGEVAGTTSGGTPSRKHPEYYTNGTVPWVKSGELRDGIVSEVEEFITEEALSNSSAKVFPKGTPVVALYGATVGKTGILGIDAATNQAVCAIFALKSAFTSKFITHWLQFQRPNLIELSTGGAQPNISQRIVRAFPFPLAPPNEQRRIVAEIETQFTRLDAAVAALERAQANLRRYKAAVLQAACEGRLVPTEAELARAEGRNYEPADQLLARILVERRARWEADYLEKQRAKGKEPKDDRWKQKYKEPVSLGMENLPELPEGWVWATIDQIADHRLGKMLDKAKNKGTPRPYLRNLNVRWFGFDLTDIQYMRVMDEELDNVSVRAGDLIVCEGGEPGRAAIWDKPGEPMVIQKALHRVRPAVGISPWYLAYRLASDASTGVLEKYFTGSTIKHFTGQSLRSYIFPLPPTSEQRRIVAEVERRLSVVAALEVSVGAAMTRAGRLRQAVLKQAFEGRLVPQDPEDEPASVLLERIRAEKAQRETERKPKGRGSGRKRRRTDKAQQLELL